jgi:hypothetical protein
MRIQRQGEAQPVLALAREVRYATEELASSHRRLAVALDASTDDLARSLAGRSVTAAVFIRGIRAATVHYARRLEEAVDHYEALREDQD